MRSLSIHVGIISWEGRHSSASHIASELVDHVDNLTVIYSNSAEETESGKGEWIKIDNANFFGPKFKALVDRVSEDVFLLIAADAEADNWADVVHSCSDAFAEQNGIGYWAPEVRVTPFSPEVVVLSEGESMQVDCINLDTIVCAMSKEVYEHVRTYPIENNNFGWGVDFAASAAAMQKDLRIVMDRSIVVSHPPSRGYNDEEAQQQLNRMLTEIPSADRVAMKLIEIYCFKRRIEIKHAPPPMGVRQALKVLVTRIVKPVLSIR